MNSNNEPTRNSEQRQRHVKPIEAWASCGQSSALQRRKAWFSAVLRRMQ